ncbi:WD-40 repeat protein [Cylindrospermum sp. NIES-4074]|nr:WD-40 repeat protein [Cylindrospermum sp. NIES-4074]
MNNLDQLAEFAADNKQSLQTLIRAIRLSQGEFSLILLRCNYGNLQEHLVQQLRELTPIEICEIHLPASVKTLYTSILIELGDEQPKALMVFGLESVKELDMVLTSANQVREEFRKQFPFPTLLWVNDQVLQKLIRLATDLENWATIIEFGLTTDELVNLLGQKTDEIFAGHTIPNPLTCWELETARKDLQIQGQVLEPALQASIEFVLGLENYLYDQIETALGYYRSSLAFWQRTEHLERQGILLLYIALAYYRKAELNRGENKSYWQESKHYLQQCIDIFEKAQRPDLVAKHISKLGEVLLHLQAWDELDSLAQKSWKLHQKYGNLQQLAQDYSFLAEVMLQQTRYYDANQLIQQALQILVYIPNLQRHEYGLYWFILARSQQGLGDVTEAISNLKRARKESNPQYNPQLYISILEKLRSLYFEQRQYLEAFHIKQEQLQVEHQYGFRAFIGAGYLHPQRQAINPALAQVNHQDKIAPEIAVSGRQQDVKRLIERISGTEQKLIVIHGQSGVGKSSILNGGLIPALKQQAIGERDALPVLLRLYTDWVGILGQSLAKAFEEIRANKLPVNLDSQAAIIEQLRKNADRNLLTVLFFDQFEEFFFAYTDKIHRLQFYEFLRTCLDIPFVKVILSLREDYLHYLLECDRLVNLTATNNNILDKNIRYYFGNFSPEDAKAVIQTLTEQTRFHLEPALIDQLVEDLGGALGEVRPIELQIIGTQLQSSKITTLEKYRQFGTKENLVDLFLETAIQDCGEPNERAARLVLYLLTDETGTRPLRTRADLAANLATEAEKIDLVLEIFVQSGLVLLLPEVPANRYQLVHDYLVSFIRQQQGSELLAELRKAQKEQIIKEKTNRNLKTGLIGSITAICMASALAWQSDFARQQTEEFQVGQSDVLSRYSDQLFGQGKEFDALVAGLHAGIPLERVGKDKADPNTQLRVQEVLQQALDSVRERNRLEGHNNYVTSINFSPDGKTLASGSADNTIKIWNVATGQEIRTLKGHGKWVNTISFSPDGKTLASGSYDKTIKLWNVATGEEIRRFNGHGNYVMNVSFSPDGKTLASGSYDKTIKLWNVVTGKEIRTLKGHSDVVNSVSFSPDRKTLASSSNDYTIKLWNVATGREIRTLKGHSNSVMSISFSPDGKTLASGSFDKTIKFWDVVKGKVIRTLKGHSDAVNSVSFSPNGKDLASGSADNTFKFWNVATGREIRTLKGHSNYVMSISFSPDSKTLASGSYDKTIRLWNLAKINEIRPLTGHSSYVRSISFSPDGKTLASGSADKTVKLWNVDMGQEISTLKGHRNWVLSLSFSPDGKTLASGGGDNTIKLWNLTTGQLIRTLTGHSAPVGSVSFNPNGKTLASGSNDKTIKLWNVATGQEIRTLTGHSDWVNSVSSSPDGKILASGSNDKTIKIWNAATGQVINVLTGHSAAVRSVSFSPDGKTLASGSYDDTIKLWNVATGKEIRTLTGHSDWVNSVSFSSVSFSPDGKILASGSADNTIKLWNVATGKEIRTLKGHREAVLSVNFSPDGKTLASGSDDNTVILWNNWKEPNLQLHNLLVSGCDWAKDYLDYNSKVSESDRDLCKNINQNN